MNKNYILTKGQQYTAVSLAIVLSMLVVWAAVNGASTISSNISTGGTLTVTGASTLTGNVSAAGTLTVTGLTTMGYASGTTMSLTGNVLVNGYATTTGSNGNITTQGTLTVAGLSTVTGFVSTASSSISANLNVSSFGVATDSAATEIAAQGTGTTTLRLLSSTATKGSCIELQDEYGKAYKLQVSSSTPSYGNGLATTTAGQAGFLAVWEPGHCK